MLSACGSGSDRPRSGGSTTTAASSASPKADTGLAAAQAGLGREISRLTWPDAYTPTVESLTPKLGDPKEIVLNEDMGTSLANIWNLCAWLNEGVDRIEASAAPAKLDEVASQISDWAAASPDGVDTSTLIEGIRTGDPTDANQFIEANACRSFPK
jgi:hypothetical protein